MEAIIKHQKMSKDQARQKAIDMLKLVGIPSPEKRIDQYPHEFSGGMRQRAMIAMALSCEPKLLIADEPTTALDVTIQAQILELMKDLKDRLNTSIILITHDLGVVADVCTRIIVMYGGLIMEEGTTEEIFYKPQHPYTLGLMRSIPKMSDKENKERRLKNLVEESLQNSTAIYLFNLLQLTPDSWQTTLQTWRGVRGAFRAGYRRG